MRSRRDKQIRRYEVCFGLMLETRRVHEMIWVDEKRIEYMDHEHAEVDWRFMGRRVTGQIELAQYLMSHVVCGTR